MNKGPQQYMLFYFTSTPALMEKAPARKVNLELSVGFLTHDSLGPSASSPVKHLTPQSHQMAAGTAQDARVKGGGAQPACVKRGF